MTREEIAKSLKPLEWDIWEGNKYRFAQPTEAHEAMIMTKDDGNFLVKISKQGAWKQRRGRWLIRCRKQWTSSVSGR